MSFPILSFPQMGTPVPQSNNTMDQYPVGTPVLVNPTQPPARPKPALIAPSAPATGNARGSARGVGFPTIPDNRINMMTEGLMRIGGAGLAAGDDGLATYGAMLGQYGNLQDMNRQYDMDRYNAELAQAQEEQRRQDLMRKLQSKPDKTGDKPDNEALAQADYQIETMETILAGLQEGGLTGIIDGTAGKWLDRMGITDWWTGTDEGSKRAYLRQLLQEFKVDQTLTKTAHTKGAISNQEMALFMSPFPDVALDNEGAWIPQIQKRLEIAKKIRAAAAGEPYNPTTAPTTPTEPTVDQSVIDEANSIINGG